MHIEIRKEVGDLFPELDHLLKVSDEVKKWALAKVDEDTRRERMGVLTAKKEGDVLESMYFAQEALAERRRVEEEEGGPPSLLAMAGWFNEAQRCMAIEALAQHMDSSDPVRRMLARRALWRIGFIE